MIQLNQLTTERRNPQTAHIDELDTLAMVTLINNEDQTVPLAVRDVLPQIAAAIDLIADRLRCGHRLIYIGAGTSGRLGILDAVECPPTYGTSPDLVGGLTYARELGAATIALSCSAVSTIAELADIAITPVTGPEAITGSTRMKAGTAQKLVLNMLSTGTMIKLGKVYGNLMVDVKTSNLKLEERARRIVMEAADCTREDAIAALDAANGNAKLAILLQLTGCTPAEGTSLLAKAQGKLSLALQQKEENTP